MRRQNRINKRLSGNKMSQAMRDSLCRELIQTEKQLNQSRKASRLYEERKAIEAIQKTVNTSLHTLRSTARRATTSGH